MTEKDAFRNISLWKSGTPIKEARLQFAPEALVARLKENPEISTLERMQSVFVKPGQTNAESIALMKIAVETFKVKDEDRRAILQEIDQNFLSLVKSGKIRCFAFEYPRTLAANPVEMLPEHWTHWPNWEKGEFRASGIHLIELRIVASEGLGERPVAPPPAAQGRPTYKTEILEAHEALHSKNAFITKPLSHGIHQIRAWIQENRPDSKAAQGKLSDDTIRNTLKPLLENLGDSEVEKL